MNFFINNASAEELGSSMDNAIAPVAASDNTIATVETKSTPNAQAPIEQGFMNFLPLIIIFVVFYFFLIRPQAKKQKEQQKMVETLKKNDKVVLSSGIIATIHKVEDNNEYLVVEIAEGVKVRILRSAVIQMMVEKTEIIEKEALDNKK